MADVIDFPDAGARADRGLRDRFGDLIEFDERSQSAGAEAGRITTKEV